MLIHKGMWFIIGFTHGPKTHHFLINLRLISVCKFQPETGRAGYITFIKVPANIRVSQLPSTVLYYLGDNLRSFRMYLFREIHNRNPKDPLFRLIKKHILVNSKCDKSIYPWTISATISYVEYNYAKIHIPTSRNDKC